MQPIIIIIMSCDVNVSTLFRCNDDQCDEDNDGISLDLFPMWVSLLCEFFSIYSKLMFTHISLRISVLGAWDVACLV